MLTDSFHVFSYDKLHRYFYYHKENLKYDFIDRGGPLWGIIKLFYWFGFSLFLKSLLKIYPLIFYFIFILLLKKC